MPTFFSPHQPSQFDDSQRNAMAGGFLLSRVHPSDKPGIEKTFNVKETSSPEPSRESSTPDAKSFVDNYVEEKISAPSEDYTRRSAYRSY